MNRSVTRVIYVEDDPALRGILTNLLRHRSELEIVGAFGTSSEALECAQEEPIDAALLDLNLGADALNGIELGIQLRAAPAGNAPPADQVPRPGVVIMTQYQVPEFLVRLEPELRHGWSFLSKRADINPRYLSDVLVASARGLNVVDPTMLDRSGDGAAARLTPRQREAISLAAQGLEAATIAERLDIKPAAARQELSRAYAVLVPDPPVGADIRTLAVLAWLRETRGHADQ